MSQLDFYRGLTGLLARKYISEHRVVHKYGFCMVVKTAQDGDWNAHV